MFRRCSVGDSAAAGVSGAEEGDGRDPGGEHQRGAHGRAAVYGTALLISGRATRKQRIPFGPFMIAGAFLAVLLS